MSCAHRLQRVSLRPRCRNKFECMMGSGYIYVFFIRGAAGENYCAEGRNYAAASGRSFGILKKFKFAVFLAV